MCVLAQEQVLFTLIMPWMHSWLIVEFSQSSFNKSLGSWNCKTFVLINDEEEMPASPVAVAGEYEALLTEAASLSTFQISMRNLSLRRQPGNERVYFQSSAIGCFIHLGCAAALEHIVER